MRLLCQPKLPLYACDTSRYRWPEACNIVQKRQKITVVESPQGRNPHGTFWRQSWAWTGENTQNYVEHNCLEWQTMQLIYRKVYACRVWLHSEFSELILWSWHVCSHICLKTSKFTRYWVLYHTPPQIRTSDAIYRLFNMKCLNYVRGIPSGVTKWGLSTVLQIFPDMRANFHDPGRFIAVRSRMWCLALSLIPALFLIAANKWRGDDSRIPHTHFAPHFAKNFYRRWKLCGRLN